MAQALALPTVPEHRSNSPTALAPFLHAKLTIPEPRHALVVRPQLHQHLDRVYQHAVTLLAAPAGFGKTTLIGTWAQAQPGSVAWVALEAGENDPTRFWTYLLTALDTTYPGSATTALSALQAAQPGAIDTALLLLLNTLATVPDPLVLVLDDCHVLTQPSVSQTLTFFIDHLPPSMHLVLVSRSDPPLPLARFRGRGALLELRADLLSFTADEASELLNQIMALNLDETDITTLVERTEGWVTGLRLVALALQGELDRSAFITTFQGSDRFTLDYLVDEVLAQQPDEIQQFLLQTAVLERLTASLCDAVTEGSHGQAILEQLDRANLFLVPLDRERRWYRYHHLFAECLRVRLHQAAPESLAPLHQRAATWHVEHGAFAEAVTHALAAGNNDQAADLLEQIGDTLMQQGDIITLQTWLTALPEAILRARPRLALAQAWMQVARMRPDQVDRWLDAAVALGDTAPEEDDALDRTALRAEAALIRTVVAVMQGAVAPTLGEIAQPLAQMAPRRRAALHHTTALALSFASLARGDVAAARHVLDEAATLSDARDVPQAAWFERLLLANLDVVQGHLRAAATAYASLLTGLPATSERPQPLHAILYAGLSRLRYAQNDLQAAEHFARSGVRLGAQVQDARVESESWVMLARVHQARGNTVAAETALQRAEQVGRQAGMQQCLAQVDTERARLAIAQGTVTTASRWAAWYQAARSASPTPVPFYERSDQELVLAQVLIAEGQLDAAQNVLVQLRDTADAGGWTQIVIEALVLQASVWLAQDEPETAMEHLLRALVLAEPEGYIRVFVDAATSLRPLVLSIAAELHAGRSQRTPGVSSDYVTALIAAQEQPEVVLALPPPAMPSPEPATTSGVDHLSERERQVLALIAAGLSNQAVAQRLVVSVGTVKTHLINIYSKLNVHSRTQAVARARTLQLV